MSEGKLKQPHEFTGPIVNGQRICKWCSGTPNECSYVSGPYCDKAPGPTPTAPIGKEPSEDEIAQAIALSDYPDESLTWPDDFSPQEREDYRTNARAITALRLREFYTETRDTITALVEALDEAREAIASLPEDGLGMAQIAFGTTGVDVYPIRDELLSNIDVALTKARSA